MHIHSGGKTEGEMANRGTHGKCPTERRQRRTIYIDNILSSSAIPHSTRKTASQPYPYVKAESRCRNVFWASINSKMLAAGISADIASIVSLQTLNICSSQLTTKVRIFAVRLLHNSSSNVMSKLLSDWLPTPPTGSHRSQHQHIKFFVIHKLHVHSTGSIIWDRKISIWHITQTLSCNIRELHQ